MTLKWGMEINLQSFSLLDQKTKLKETQALFWERHFYTG